MTRTGKIGLAIVCLLTAAVAAFLVARPANGLRDRYHRIQLGMTPEEVEQVMGCTSGYYADSDRTGYGDTLAQEGEDFRHDMEVWAYNDGEICVWTNDTGRIVGKAFVEAYLFRSETFIQRVRRQLGL